MSELFKDKDHNICISLGTLLHVFMSSTIYFRKKSNESSFLCDETSDFFLPIDTGTGTDSIWKNGIKIKRIGIFYQCTCNVKLISKEEKVRTRQDALISLSGNICCYDISEIVIG